MEKTIESDINSSSSVVNHVEDDVAVNVVPVEDAQACVTESKVVDGDVDPQVVGVKVSHSQGGVR